MEEHSTDPRAIPICEADPPAGHTLRGPEGPPPVDFDHTRTWLKKLLRAADQIGSAALTPEQLAEIDAHLAFAAWNQPRFESAIGILEAILEAVSGAAAARSPLMFADLTPVLDTTLAELSGNTVLSVAGLNRMLPGPLSPTEVDQFREQLPNSSVRDAVRETVFANTEARREVLAAAMPSLAPPPAWPEP
ncbi:hypothetical protein OG225_41940 (plasmid) [Nocardia sp. NBC_01377]|uniref:hypothetical protein n=1 Tax=Nocardia sp. NBC_01377 TaxID=2903595 RepID=UPI002F91872C